jgi:acyl carrier protein
LSKDTLGERLLELLTRHLRDVPADVDWETALLPDLGLDSMSAIELVLELEEELGVQFPEELLVRETFATVPSLEQAVRRMTGRPARPAVTSFEEFIRPLVAAPDVADLETLPLSRLPAGDFAVLAWLDDVHTHYPAAVSADLIARWDALSLRDVYALLVPADSAASAS